MVPSLFGNLALSSGFVFSLHRRNRMRGALRLEPRDGDESRASGPAHHGGGAALSAAARRDFQIGGVIVGHDARRSGSCSPSRGSLRRANPYDQMNPADSDGDSWPRLAPIRAWPSPAPQSCGNPVIASDRSGLPPCSSVGGSRRNRLVLLPPENGPARGRFDRLLREAADDLHGNNPHATARLALAEIAHDFPAAATTAAARVMPRLAIARAGRNTGAHANHSPMALSLRAGVGQIEATPQGGRRVWGTSITRHRVDLRFLAGQRWRLWPAGCVGGGTWTPPRPGHLLLA